MTKQTAIRNFILSVTGLPFHVRRADHWETNSYDTIYYCLAHDEDDIAFRQDFVRRCPLADAFMDVTLSILHEIGHCVTADETDGIYPNETTCTHAEYFAAHDEMIATDWAISWISKRTNQITAKKFEKIWRETP